MNSYNKILIALSSILILTSCDIFEPKLDNTYDESRTLNDPAFAEGLLLNGYRLIPRSFYYDEVATDDAVTNNLNSGYLQMATGSWSSTFNPLNVWDDCYDVIFHLNQFLSIVDDMTWSWESDKRDDLFRSRLKGEALALRGYYHFLLLVNHGGVDQNDQLMGVPLILDVIDREEFLNVKRATYQATVDAIFADLDDAIELLPYEYANQGNDGDYNRVNGELQRGRLSGKIAIALKARIAMHVASPSFNNGIYNSAYSELAAKSVKDVIGSESLPTDGLLFYDQDSDINSREIIWRDSYSDIRWWEEAQYPPSLYGRGEVNPSQNLVNAFPMKNGQPIDAENGYNPQDPYNNRDPRLEYFILYNGGNIGNRTINTNTESATDGLNNTTASTRTGYYLKKTLRPDVTLNPGSANTRRHFKPYIRFTELYLIYAEAANEAWGPDGDPNGYGLTAREAIAEIRQRANIDQPDLYLAQISSKEQMRELIRNERRIELSFEGFRFWDIRRWEIQMNETVQGISISNNQYTVIDVENRRFEPHMKFGPIPLNETLKNKELLQNKGW